MEAPEVEVTATVEEMVVVEVMVGDSLKFEQEGCFAVGHHVSI